MTRVFILYTKYLTVDGKDKTIGGVQTYISALSQTLKKNGMKPVIMQYAECDFTRIVNGVEVVGVKMKKHWTVGKKSKTLLNKCIEISDTEKDVIIVAAHSMGVNNKLHNVIGIQHGITFDTGEHSKKSKLMEIVHAIKRILQGMNLIIKSRRFNYLVSVDYNFLNWMRTMPGYKSGYVRVIPNFTKIKNFNKPKNDTIKIIFARRFERYRGTRLFSEVALKILRTHKNVKITFAGDGPDEKYLKDKFKNMGRVNFIKYDNEDSMEIHKLYDIAVVPTISSEGTSLSLLEAMAAKCSVVATNVGGITNIILDNFNGLLVDPNELDLYDSINKLICDNKLRTKLAENAYNSVSQSFNYNIWEKRWLDLLNNVIKK